MMTYRIAKYWRSGGVGRTRRDGGGTLHCRARARAAVLVPQHVRGGGRERGAVALQVVRQGGVQPLAPLPLAHGAALALPLLPRHLQPHRHAPLPPAPQARGSPAQALGAPTTPDDTRRRTTPPTPRRRRHRAERWQTLFLVIRSFVILTRLHLSSCT